MQSCNVMLPVMGWEHTPNKLLKLKSSVVDACLSLRSQAAGLPRLTPLKRYPQRGTWDLPRTGRLSVALREVGQQHPAYATPL